jgi:hypothetical protein
MRWAVWYQLMGIRYMALPLRNVTNRSGIRHQAFLFNNNQPNKWQLEL